MTSPVAATPLIAQIPECCMPRIIPHHLPSFHLPAIHHAVTHHAAHHAALERDLVPLGCRQIRLRHGVGGKAHRRIERMLAQRRRILVDQIEQPVLEAA